MLKHLSIKIIQSFCLLFCLGFLANNKLIAEDVQISYEFYLKLNEGSGSIGELIININNQDQEKIVDTYEITIPISDVENISVFLSENEENNYQVVDLNGYKKITVALEKPVMPSESKSLKIKFTSPVLLVSNFGLKQLYIQNPFDNLTKNINYKIEYPKKFGNIYRSFNSQYITEKDTLTNILEVESTSGIYVLWADEIKVNLQNYVNVKNEDSLSNSFLYNLPNSSKRQTVYFNEIKNIDEAYSDEYNLFGQVDLESKSNKDIGYSADIIIKDGLEKTEIPLWPEKYNYEFNTKSSFGNEVLEATKNTNDTYTKFQIFNQILKNNANPNKQSAITSNDFNSLWDKFDGDRTLNSFEYAALSASFAEYLGLKSRLEYGYIILSPIEMDLSRPQVWVVIEIDGKEIFSDQFMEDVSNISYFDINYIDRVKFGVWHDNQTYNPAIGLAYNGTQLKAQLKNVEEKNYDLDFSVSLNYPDSIASGSFYQGELFLENKSQRALAFESLYINNVPFINMIKSDNGLYPVVLPGNSKTIQINNLREANIFNNSSQKIETKLLFTGINDEVIKENEIRFYIDLRNAILFIAIFAFLVSVFGFIYLKIRKSLS